MSKRLPPLLALEAFDAAARSMSFKAAASELHLTPSAISHRVKQLEQYLGRSLFRRMNREIRLTEAGQEYFGAVRRAFDQVAQASLRVGQPQQVEELRLSAVPYFATTWIIPNLEDFLNRQPNLRLFVESSIRNADFARDAVDATVRYGHGRWPGLSAVKLTGSQIAPVCAPKLRRSLKQPRDLAGHTLIHLSSFPESWPNWLTAAGVPGLKPKREVWVDGVSQALDAAENGLGVSLGLIPLIGPKLQAERLQIPFGPMLPLEYDYWFVCRRAEADKPAVQALRRWLLDLMVKANVSMKGQGPSLPQRKPAKRSIG